MIDEFVEQINTALHVSARRRARIVEEIRDHLDDAVARLVSQGVDQSIAQDLATKAFGSAPDLARQFNAQDEAAMLQRTPQIMVASGIAVVGGFLLAGITQPHRAVPVTASTIQQAAFFAAVLGIQFAFVAGLRAAARVCACWRTAPRAADHLLVRRAGFVFAGGLAVAAGGWTVALVLATRHGLRLRAVPFVAGVVMMIAATVVTFAAVMRRHQPRLDEQRLVLHNVEPPLTLGVAERAIQRMSRRPQLACASVAVAAAVMAMSHAETSVQGALPWGAIQAVAVVAGFLLLGPLLELRSTGAV